MNPTLLSIFFLLLSAQLSKAQGYTYSTLVSSYPIKGFDTISVLAVTVDGDSLDLSAYISKNYVYPQRLLEYEFDGSMYYRVVLNAQNKLDSLICVRPIRGTEKLMGKDPLPDLFNKIAQLFVFPAPAQQAFLLRIRIEILTRPEPERAVKIEPVEVKKKRRKK